MIEDYHVPETRCPGCGALIDGATPVSGGRRPRDGDISLCLYCGHIAAYGSDCRLRPLTDEEVHDIAGDSELIRATKLYALWRSRPYH